MIWHNAKTNPPKIHRDVLLAVCGQSQVAEGWQNIDGTYQYTSGHPVEVEVYAWTELPACPSIGEVAS